MTRRLYPDPLPVGPNRHPHDQIRDAEAFCRRYLDEAFDGWGMWLRPDDYDESLSLLIVHLWRLGDTFNPERNDCFANYARTIIPKRAADVGPRRLLGRNGTRTNDYLFERLDESDHGHRPLQALPTEPSSENPHWGPTRRGLQPHRNSNIAWAATILGVRTPKRAA